MKDFVGGVELGNEIGRGATGTVFRGMDGQGRELALKILHPQLATDPTVVGRFVQERQIYGQIKHHNVVEVVDLIADGERLAVAMEFVEGGTLAQLIAGGYLPASEAVRLAAELAEGLDAIHESGAVHRDLKPANILLGGTADVPVPKIADFGLSGLLGNSLSRLSGAIGTPLYMSPEVAMGTEKATGASDVYALGVILFEMLAGRPPFEGDNPLAVARKHADEAPPRLSGVPATLQSLLDRLMAKSPAERPSPSGAALELRALIGQLQDTGPISAVPAAPGPGTRFESTTLSATQSMQPPPEPAPLTVSLPPSRVSTIPIDEVESPLLRPNSESYVEGFEQEPEVPVVDPASVPLRIAAAALLGVVVVFVGYLILRPGDKGTQLADGATYTFLPRVVDQMVLSRTWTLDSANGVVDVSALATNGSDEPILDYVHLEVFPDWVPDLGSIQFEPPASELVESDHLARFELDKTEPGEQVAIRYSFAVGEITTREDLVAAAELVAELERDLLDATGAESLELVSLRLRPTTLRLEVGEEEEFVVAGTMSDESDAADELLSSAEWTVGDESIAVEVGDGFVVGVSEGETELTVAAGDIRATAELVVVAGEQNGNNIAGPSSGSGSSTNNPSNPGTPSTKTTKTTETPETNPQPVRVEIVSGVSIGFKDQDSFQFSYQVNGVCAAGGFRVVGPGVSKTWNGDGLCYDSTTHGGFPQATGPFGGFELQPGSTYQVTAWVDGVASNGTRPAGTGRDEISFSVTTDAAPLPVGSFTISGPTAIEVDPSFPQAQHPDFRINVDVSEGGPVSLSSSGACTAPSALGGGGLFQLSVADVGTCVIVGTQEATTEFAAGSQKTHTVEISRRPPTTATQTTVPSSAALTTGPPTTAFSTTTGSAQDE